MWTIITPPLFLQFWKWAWYESSGVHRTCTTERPPWPLRGIRRDQKSAAFRNVSSRESVAEPGQESIHGCPLLRSQSSFVRSGNTSFLSTKGRYFLSCFYSSTSKFELTMLFKIKFVIRGGQFLSKYRELWGSTVWPKMTHFLLGNK